MGFQDKDFSHQKLMRVLPFTDPDLMHALLSCANNIHLHVSHVNTSYRGFLLVQSLNIFVPVSGDPQQNTRRLGEMANLGGSSRNIALYGFPYNVEYIWPKEPIATQVQWL